MTVADFLDALKTKGSIRIIQGEEVIIEFMNTSGVVDRLAADISGANITTIEVISCLAGGPIISVTIEAAP